LHSINAKGNHKKKENGEKADTNQISRREQDSLAVVSNWGYYWEKACGSNEKKVNLISKKVVKN